MTAQQAKTRDVYAIKVGDHVELRASRTQPRKIVSKISKTFTIQVTRLKFVEDETSLQSFWGGHYERITENIPRKSELKQVFFVDGTVLGYIKLRKFARLFGAGLKPDKLLKLTQEQASLILNPRWRKKHLK